MHHKENKVDLERAWKDEAYRKTLTPAQLAQLSPNPAGEVELSDEELDGISGGTSSRTRYGNYYLPPSGSIQSKPV